VTGDGTLVYMGGIDDKPTTRLEDLKTAKNFVDAALSEVAEGKVVSIKTSRAYGCTIKYSS
ncbi:MAG TPA: thioredoxin family protein, partial [Hyphomicrobiaceae bacterium]|nr:thioredoxin family protein [Hyphomicrobiaceae bacterium]